MYTEVTSTGYAGGKGIQKDAGCGRGTLLPVQSYREKGGAGIIRSGSALTNRKNSNKMFPDKEENGDEEEKYLNGRAQREDQR